MALKIMGHLFTGPLSIDRTVVRPNHPPAVFVVLSKEGPPWDPVFRFIDVGISGENPMAFSTHAKRAEWERRCKGELNLYLLSMDEAAGYKPYSRAAIAAQIQTRYAAPNDIVTITQ